MNENQTLALLAMIEQVYPGRISDVEASLAIWTEMLSDQNPALIMAGFKKWAKTERFPPSVADLIRAAADETDGDIPTWMECKAAIEASSHGRGLPKDAHPVTRATAVICGGPVSLAAMSPYDAERAVRSAHSTGLARYQRSLTVGHRRGITEGGEEERRQAIEAVSSTMFAKP